jgi:hypothetical protein
MNRKGKKSMTNWNSQMTNWNSQDDERPTSKKVGLSETGSGDRTRTCDPLINSQLLYQLSYTGIARGL